nr:uncharacterized protein K02A2.6-like [Parasteatoda tepidariorum]
MLADKEDTSTVANKIQRFLLTYRATPHSRTAKSPAELFLGRGIRTTLDLLHPSTSSHVTKKQASQKFDHDRAHYRYCTFEPDQIVWVRSHKPNQKWIQGKLVKPKGFNTGIVQISGKLFLAHNDQLRSCLVIDNDSTIDEIPTSLIIVTNCSPTVMLTNT